MCVVKKQTGILFVCSMLLALFLSGCGCEHVFGSWMEELPATCTSEGKQVRICSECNEIESEPIPVIDHSYGDWKVTKAATCTETGLKVKTCSGCESTIEESVSVIDHSYGEWKVTKAATCTETGLKVKTCSGCESTVEESVPVIDHSYGDWKVTKAATCTETGLKVKTCSGCESTLEESIPVIDHSYGDWRVTKAATCTETGLKVKTCSGCESAVEESVPVIDHSYGDWKVTKTATCTEPGVKVKTCKNCGSKIEEDIAAQHKWKDATCTTAKTCTVCNTKNGDPKGHKWKSATCTAPKTCSSCGETEGKSLGHTSGSNGKCTRCGTKVTIDMTTKISAPTEEFAILRGMNSVGLIKLVWTADNISGKTIKYYTVTGYYYNAVGDPAENDITGKTYHTVKYVGPVEPNGMLLVSELGYCSICDYVVIGEITLEYTDGTTDTGWYGYKIPIP